MVINRVGPPVRGNDFFGREAFVNLASEKLKAGHVLLGAPRRFGKTSVMYRLMDAPEWDYRIVHADLEHLSDPASLIAELTEKLAKDGKLAKVISGLSWLSQETWSRFRDTIEEVELFEVKIKLKEKLRESWQERGEELFKRIATANTTVVFFLDEFPMMIDRMARSEKHREEAKLLLQWLRALRVRPDLASNVRFLIAGSIGIGRVLNELGQIASINDFESLKLDPFTPKVAADFLDVLAKSAKIQLTQPTKRKMLDVIGTPVPYFLQIIFSEVSKAHFLDGETITPKKVEMIYHSKVLGVDCKTYFDHYYSRFREYYQPHEEKAAKRMLRELAVVGAMTRDACFQFYKSEVANADLEAFNLLMTDLENDFYISFDSEKRQYQFSCKLLRDWWLRHYGMEANG
ncbi:MAG: hypothetical protein SF097_13185 [Acidobacteriota bacterium]|nr:hypothetical protein [Acidobacteriota bacterium]